MEYGIMNDREIHRLSADWQVPPMIQPFESMKVREIEVKCNRGECVIFEGPLVGTTNCSDPEHTRKKVVSYGVSSFGYDVRVADEFRVFSPTSCAIVDPKHFDERAFVTVKGPECLIPPNSFALGRSVERFDIPRDVMSLIFGKSTYARCGILIGTTPAEPGWKGHLTIEISNTTPLPARIYANEGICQMVFFRAEKPCDDDYGADGRYQDQGPEIVLPRV